MVWTSRNNHRCVGKQIKFIFTSNLRMQTCVLWLLKIIHLLLKEEKHVKLRYFCLNKLKPFESLLCHSWLASLSLVSMSCLGLSHTTTVHFHRVRLS